MNTNDRISPLSILLDDVFYKSSIQGMRRFYFSATKGEHNWFLLSDYYFGDDKPNKVITFTAMPSCPYILDLKSAIKAVAPKDIKHTRNVNSDFVALMNLLPLINVVFIFDNKKHFIWDNVEEAKVTMQEHVKVLRACQPLGNHRTRKGASAKQNNQEPGCSGKSVREGQETSNPVGDVPDLSAWGVRGQRHLA